MTDYTDAVEIMRLCAGSFFKVIAQAWVMADSANRARLEEAFRADFERYAQLARMAKDSRDLAEGAALAWKVQS